MDIKKLRGLAFPIFQKYKYAILILGVGVLLMLIPGTNKKVKESATSNPVIKQDISTQEELESVLSMIQGAGNVKVLLKESPRPRARRMEALKVMIPMAPSWTRPRMMICANCSPANPPSWLLRKSCLPD